MRRVDSHPRAITLLIPGLTGGGAEKVLVRMADHWEAEGHRVTLITLSGTADDVYRPADAVHRVALDLQTDSRGMLSAIGNNWRRVSALRKAITESKPDVAISFTEQMNVLALLAARKRNFPLIVSERVDPRQHRIGRVWSSLRRITYPTADCVVVQTKAVAAHMARLAKTARIEVIPNGVDPPRVELLPLPQRRKVFVAAGRLVKQKGFDLLIEAFARIAQRHPEWSLEIYGSGPLEGELRDQVSRAGLESRVVLAGWADNLDAVLARSSVFVLSSRYEGFPNALLDAMAHGCACVSFACESGPEEIIEHEENGLLVEAESVSDLADTMSRLADDLELRTQLGEAAMKVSEQFSHSQIISAWDELIAASTDRRN